MKPKKTLISIRLDDDVVKFFKESGPGYQTRINQVLRSYAEHMERMVSKDKESKP